MRRFLFLALALTWLPVAFAEGPDDDYLQVYALIQRADALNESDPTKAVGKYREAQIALLKFQQTYPGWNRNLVSLRLRDLETKLGNPQPAASPETLVGTPGSSGVGGLFPKMAAAPKVFVADCRQNREDAKMAAWSLQGLVNQQLAEAYVINNPQHVRQLEFCKKPYEMLPVVEGRDAGLLALFRKFEPRVKRLFVYDPNEDWTWYLALMSGAQQEGIAVTDRVRILLESEFNWKGEVQDFRKRWPNRIAAYDWALTNLMPGCTKKVVFIPHFDRAITDYAAATRGFAFRLDFKSEQDQIRKIFQTKGYTVGTSLMGYAGDEANATANPYGIGYVVSDRYSNGSFWSSFPNKTYQQSPGRPVKAEPGKIYASITWSDGDNIAFDQGPIYKFWNDSDRGKVPVATPLSPSLLELNSPLLDWYYARMTEKDELMAGPTGFQFIYIQDYNDRLFPEWCRLNRLWCAAAGFHFARIWLAPNPSVKYTAYMKSCGLDGLFGEGSVMQPGFPPKLDTYGAWDENKLFEEFTKVKPNPQAPVFVSFTPIVEGFDKRDGGYSAIKRQVDRLEAAYPGRYVFQLPKDQFATLRAYYK